MQLKLLLLTLVNEGSNQPASVWRLTWLDLTFTQSDPLHCIANILHLRSWAQCMHSLSFKNRDRESRLVLNFGENLLSKVAEEAEEKNWQGETCGLNAENQLTLHTLKKDTHGRCTIKSESDKTSRRNSKSQRKPKAKRTAKGWDCKLSYSHTHKSHRIRITRMA